MSAARGRMRECRAGRRGSAVHARRRHSRRHPRRPRRHRAPPRARRRPRAGWRSTVGRWAGRRCADDRWRRGIPARRTGGRAPRCAAPGPAASRRCARWCRRPPCSAQESRRPAPAPARRRRCARASIASRCEIGGLGPRGQPCRLRALAARHVLGVLLAVEHHARRPTSRKSTCTSAAPTHGDVLVAHAVVRARRTGPKRDVGEIAVAVGETPGHLAVGARGHGRRARQRHAGHVQRLLAIDAQPRRVPDRGHAQVQVHVVGDQRHARLRVDAGHRPVVAARPGVCRGLRRRSAYRPATRAAAPGTDAWSRAAEPLQADCTHGGVGGIVRRVPARVAGVEKGDELVRGLGSAARGAAARSSRRRSSLGASACRTAVATTSNAPPARSPRATTARGVARSSRYSHGRARETRQAGVHAAGIRLDDGAFVRRARPR